MAMGKRGRQRQENLFIASNTLVKSPGHPFYEKLNQVLGANGFDEFVEGLCQRYYAPHMGRKGIPPGSTSSLPYSQNCALQETTASHFRRGRWLIAVWYNPHRRHSALGYLSQMNFEKTSSAVALAAD